MPNFNPQLHISQVLRTKMLNKSVIEVTFTKPQNFSYRIGQFISLKVSDTNFRAYSLSSHPNEDFLKITVSVGHNGLGANLLRDIVHGSNDYKLNFIGPSGKFFMADVPAKNIIFLATGTGIAPFMPMLFELIKNKNGQNSKISLYFGETYSDELFYLDELNFYRKLYFDFDYTICLSQEQNPKFEYGRITEKYNIKDPQITQVYLCGHPEMVSENIDRVLNLGVPAENIFHEKFTVAAPKIN